MRILKVALIFLVGVITGAIGTAYLASRASTTFAHGLELSYAFEQQRQAALLAHNEKWLEAAATYRNLIFIEKNHGNPFGLENKNWDLLFPLASLVLEGINDASDPQGKSKKISEGVAHARYALALEKIGRTNEASAEWNESVKIGGFKSVESARSLAITLLKQDVELFTK